MNFFWKKSHKKISIGSFVHWISQGQSQWTEPRKVVRIDFHDGDKYLYVPDDSGKDGWIPIDQAKLDTKK